MTEGDATGADRTDATEPEDAIGQPDTSKTATAAEVSRPKVVLPPRPFDAEDAAPVDDTVADATAAKTPAEDVLAEPEVILDDAAPDDADPFEELSALPTLLEALLFVADHPVEEAYLARALEVTPQRIAGALETLARDLREGSRGIRLLRGPEGVVLVSAPEAAQHVERFLGLEQSRKLSTAALETLAIIAYRQPITRGQIDLIRGVSSDGAVQTLRARGLIEAAGTALGPGRPTLFRTSQRFLEHFGLERTGQLPPLPEEVDMPLSEIGAQLGLGEEAIAAAFAAVEAEPGAEEHDPAPEEVAAAAALELPGDAAALAEAAEQAFSHASGRDED